MLMKMNDTSYFTFAVAVAVNCSEMDLSANPTPEQAAAYVEDVLSVTFSNTGITASVEPMAYPVTSKIPLIITLNGRAQRLLWFYPQMSACQLASELEGVFSDISLDMLSASA